VDNYFEGIDFTKIELILLFGVIAVLAPFIVLFNFDDTSTIEELEKEYDAVEAKGLLKNFSENEIAESKERINIKIDDKITEQQIKIENATKASLEAIIAIKEFTKNIDNINNCQDCADALKLTGFEVESIDEEIKKAAEIKKEALREINELEIIRKQIDFVIYKDLKSYEFQDRIFLAFGIVMVILIVAVFLSRKGYTSYTPWLEKIS